MDRELADDLAQLLSKLETVEYRLAPAPPLTPVEFDRVVGLVYAHRYATTTAQWLVDLVLSQKARLHPDLSEYPDGVLRQAHLLLRLHEIHRLSRGLASAATRHALRDDFVRALQQVCPVGSDLRVELWELLKETRPSGASALIAEDIAHHFFEDEFDLGSCNLDHARKRLERQRQRVRDGQRAASGRDTAILIPLLQ